MDLRNSGLSIELRRLVKPIYKLTRESPFVHRSSLKFTEFYIGLVLFVDNDIVGVAPNQIVSV